MQRISGAVHHGTGSGQRDFSIAFDLARAFGDDQEFLFRMPVRRMRAGSGLENRHSGANPCQLIGGAVVVSVRGATAGAARWDVCRGQHAVTQFACAERDRNPILCCCQGLLTFWPRLRRLCSILARIFFYDALHDAVILIGCSTTSSRAECSQGQS